MTPQSAQETMPTVTAIASIFEGSEVRTVLRGGEPWFVAADVAKLLGLQNARQNIAEFDEDEKGVCPIYTLGGTQSLTVLSEAGLYRLLLRSDKFTDPEVGGRIKRFRRWVTHEVLPAIRRTGGYSLPADYPAALRALADSEERLALAAPKVEAYDDLISADGLMLLREAAKVIPGAPGQNRLFDLLRAQGVIIPGSTEPYQRFVDDGYFVQRPRTYDHPKTHERKASLTTFVTAKGLDFLRRRVGGQP